MRRKTTYHGRPPFTNIGIYSITFNTNGYVLGGNGIQITNGITDNIGANSNAIPMITRHGANLPEPRQFGDGQWTHLHQRLDQYGKRHHRPRHQRPDDWRQRPRFPHRRHQQHQWWPVGGQQQQHCQAGGRQRVRHQRDPDRPTCSRAMAPIPRPPTFTRMPLRLWASVLHQLLLHSPIFVSSTNGTMHILTNTYAQVPDAVMVRGAARSS